VRGVTSLAHGIHHILDKKDTLSLIKLGIKVDSAMGVAIIGGGGNQPTFGRQTQSSNAGSSDTGAAAAPNTYEEMQGGALFKLEKGMDVKAITSDRPSPNVQTFLSYIDRDVATGLEVPIEFIWDSSSLGGSGNRFILKKAERKFADRQALIARVKRRIRNYVIAKGIKNFGLPYVDDWWKVRFQFPSRITVDVGREADANREDVYAGLRTEQSDYEERGEDFYEARNDIQEAADDLLLRATQLVQKYGKDGLTLEMAIQMMVKRGNSGSQPANQQNAKQPQDKGAK
jgi:capsid protein